MRLNQKETEDTIANYKAVEALSRLVLSCSCTSLGQSIAKSVVASYLLRTPNEKLRQKFCFLMFGK